MDTRTGRIFTPEEVDVIQNPKVSSEDFKAMFRHLPSEERPRKEDLKEMAVPPTVAQMKNKKVGRNDPCPCGSEKKFKKCCLK